MPGRWPGIRASGQMRAELPGATPRVPGALRTTALLAGEIGGLTRPFGGRHEVVAHPARHDHIPRNDPQLTAFSRFTFNDISGPDREPRGKPRLRGHDNRSINPLRNTDTTNRRNNHHIALNAITPKRHATLLERTRPGLVPRRKAKSSNFGRCPAGSRPSVEHGRKPS
jgi:hypothetical protein